MIEIAVLVALVQGSLVALYFIEARAWRVERAQLLDRLMSRTWGDYVSGTRVIDAPATPQLTTDEAEAAWYAAQPRVPGEEAA